MTRKTEKEIKQELGDRLHAYREATGLTQAQVAAKSDVSTNYYARIERGEENPSYTKIHAILTALDIKSLDIE